MDCQRSAEIMMNMLDGPLNQASEERLMFHVKECTHCAREYREWMELNRALSELPELAPSFGFEQRVMNAIDPQWQLAAASAGKKKSPSLGEMLVWTGFLGMIGLVGAEAVAQILRLSMGWLDGIPLFRAAQAVSGTLLVQGLLYVVLPLKGMVDWVVRFQGTGHWWHMLGMMNLTMLLVLVKVCLDRVLSGGRSEWS